MTLARVDVDRVTASAIYHVPRARRWFVGNDRGLGP